MARDAASAMKPRRPPGRVALTVVVCVAVLAVLLDASRPPARQLSARAALIAIHAYHDLGLGHVGGVRQHCRLRPTCSTYAGIVISRFGIARGGWLTLKRLLRCGPWTPRGTIDRPPPVQEASKRR